MSLSLYLFSKKSPTTKSVEQVILPLGFEPVDKTSGGEYFWFKTDNYESLRGCRLYISKADPEDQEIPSGTRTIFHSYSNVFRSYEDLAMQNNVIRKLKSAFGGLVYNTDEGRYAYLKNDIPRLSPAEKRCGLIYGHFRNSLGRARMVTADLDPKLVGLKQIDENLALYDTGLITNSLIAVFLVSIFEAFLRDLFVGYIEMRPELQPSIFKKLSKTDYQELKKLLEAGKSHAFNFQNLLSANRAYSTCLRLNLLELWDRKKKIGKRFYHIGKTIGELIQLRHDIVHNACLVLDFDRENIEKYRKSVEFAGEFLAEALEKQGFRIDIEGNV